MGTNGSTVDGAETWGQKSPSAPGRSWTVLLPTVSLSAQLSGSDYVFFSSPFANALSTFAALGELRFIHQQKRDHGGG